MGGKSDITDPRFIINHAGDPDFSPFTRSSNGPMLFLAVVSRMKHQKVGSLRCNAVSLFI
jgi:type I restriction enzyme M protein